jgi:multidrug efflux system membrane fusion protein
MTRKITVSIALGLLVVAGVAAFVFHGKSNTQTSQGGGHYSKDAADKPVPVVAATARSGDIDVVIGALGTVTARNTITVKSRVDGQLVRINFSEGQLAREGQVLAEIDPRTFQAQLDQAKGQLLRDQALLASARLDLKRYRDLLAKDSIASQQVDNQASLVQQYEGTVKADQAQVDSDRLQLDFTRITAPVSGRLGLRQVDTGNMIHAADTTGLVVITQTQPIAVIFAIPSDDLGRVITRLRAGDTLSVDAFDRDGKTKLATGKLLAVDNQIDTTTGTVKLKAEFANTDNALFPNQFVNARLRIETRHGATLVPTAAIQRGTPGTYFYVVGADRTVSVRPVVLGPTSGEIVAVDKGLSPGEQVVTDGTDKLRQGAKVELATAPGNQRAPGQHSHSLHQPEASSVPPSGKAATAGRGGS